MISSRVDINKQIYGIVNLVQHWLVDESSAPVKSGIYQYLHKEKMAFNFLKPFIVFNNKTEIKFTLPYKKINFCSR